MKTWNERIRSFLMEEEGATATEYAVLLTLIALACIAAVTALGTRVQSVFNNASTRVPSGS